MRRSETRYPQLSLSGRYLTEAGFEPGTVCDVEVSHGCVTIRLHQAPVQIASNLDELKAMFKTLGIQTERNR